MLVPTSSFVWNLHTFLPIIVSYQHTPFLREFWHRAIDCCGERVRTFKLSIADIASPVHLRVPREASFEGEKAK